MTSQENEKQFQPPSIHQSEKNKPEKIQKQVPSEHYQQYRQKLQHFSQITEGEPWMSLKEKFASHQIMLKESSAYQEKIKIHFKSTSANKEVVIINVEWGTFSLDVKILNIIYNNNHHGASLSSGMHGLIYKGTFMNNKFAIKCLPIKSEKTRCNAIKQFFLLKIASIAEFGPKIYSYFGFDMLMYQGCVEFAMEVCKMPTEAINAPLLYQNLTLMHKLQLIHFDIKPENIMLSPEYRKPVFIDFGLSKFVKESSSFKSLTDFRGSANHCSIQMTNILVSKKKDYVDLYYNDLFCLTSSLKFFRQSSSMLNQSQEEPYIVLPEYENQFSFLAIYLLKFYLFENNIPHFNQMWNHLDTKMKKGWEKQIFSFFLQLLPTELLKETYLNFKKDQDESQTYSRIKIVYQLSHDKLCATQLLKDQQKNQLFSSYCEQYLADDFGLENILDVLNLSLSQLLLDLQQIKKLPFRKYVQVYLQYTSYLNNQNRVDAAYRQKAATSYYCSFISNSSVPTLKGVQLVKFVIHHIFQWLIHSNQFNDQKDGFAMFAFRLLDFFILHNSANSLQFIKLINSLFDHHNLTVIYKLFFLKRVDHANLLHSKHVFIHAKESRTQFTQNICNWIEQRSKQLSIQQKAPQIFNQKGDKNKILSNSGISEEFMKQYGLQIFQYQYIDTEAKGNNYIPQLIELFNKINVQFKHPKILLFTIRIYEFYNQKESNVLLSKRIFSILKENIKDDNILSQFIFKFQLEELYKHLDQKKKIITQNQIDLIDKQLAKVKEDDLIIIKFTLLKIFNKIFIMQSFYDKQISSLNPNIKEKEHFLYRFFDSYLQAEMKSVYNLTKSHKTIDRHSIYTLLNLSQFFNPSRRLQVQSLLFKKEETEIVCSQCKTIATLNFSLNILQNCVKQYTLNYGRNIENKEKKLRRIQLLFFEELNKLQEIAQNNFKSFPYAMLQIVQTALNLAQLICLIDQKNQLKYHGIYNYYDFAIKFNKIQMYFKQQQQNSFSIQGILKLLLSSNYQQFVDLLVKLTQVVQKTQLYSQYKNILTYTCLLIFFMTVQNKKLLFLDIKKYHSTKCPQNNCIFILYLIIFDCLQESSTLKIIFKEIVKIYLKLHTRFQRQIKLYFLLKTYRRLKPIKRQHRREWVYCNHHLLKTFIVLGQTTPLKPINSKGNIKKKTIQQKMAKIQYFQKKGMRIKFLRK